MPRSRSRKSRTHSRRRNSRKNSSKRRNSRRRSRKSSSRKQSGGLVFKKKNKKENKKLNKCKALKETITSFDTQIKKATTPEEKQYLSNKQSKYDDKYIDNDCDKIINTPKEEVQSTATNAAKAKAKGKPAKGQQKKGKGKGSDIGNYTSGQRIASTTGQTLGNVRNAMGNLNLSRLRRSGGKSRRRSSRKSSKRSSRRRSRKSRRRSRK